MGKGDGNATFRTLGISGTSPGLDLVREGVDVTAYAGVQEELANVHRFHIDFTGMGSTSIVLVIQHDINIDQRCELVHFPANLEDMKASIN